MHMSVNLLEDQELTCIPHMDRFNISLSILKLTNIML